MAHKEQAVETVEVETPPVFKTGGGWTGIPKALRANRKQLGLTANDLNLIEALAQLQWNPFSLVKAPRSYVADLAGWDDPRTLDKAKSHLIDLGYLRVWDWYGPGPSRTKWGLYWDIRWLWQRLKDITGQEWDDILPETKNPYSDISRWETVYEMFKNEKLSEVESTVIAALDEHDGSLASLGCSLDADE